MFQAISAAKIRRQFNIIPINGKRCYIQVNEGPKIEMVFDNVKGAADGFVWFFICPVTNIRCRTLYLFKDRYVHRSRIKGYYRLVKPAWYSGTALDELFDRMKGGIDAERLLNQKYFKINYAGKPTKKYLKCIRQKQEAEGISEHGLINGDYDHLLKIKTV